MKRPKPDPIAGESAKVPSQLLPAPVSDTGTFVPTGGRKASVGVVPAAANSVSVRLTVILVLLVVWTGGGGAVAIVPDGGVVSTIRAGPRGGPTKTLPDWSWRWPGRQRNRRGKQA